MWILVHIEVQGQTDKLFAQRMFMYFSRIFDRYNRPVTAFAILTDKNRAFRPTAFERSFMGTRLLYEFNAYKIIEQDKALLQAHPNPFATVVLTVLLALQQQRLSDNDLLTLKLDLTRRLLSASFTKEKIRSLMTFLKLYVRFESLKPGLYLNRNTTN